MFFHFLLFFFSCDEIHLIFLCMMRDETTEKEVQLSSTYFSKAVVCFQTPTLLHAPAEEIDVVIN